jgi:hypothetical protein
MNKPIFYATEKDIFDALSSKKKRVTKEILFDLCLSKGILVSKEEERDDLIEYISMLPYDFVDLSAILDLIRSTTRSERKASIDVTAELSNKEINKVVNGIKKDREKYGETFKVVSESNKKAVIQIEYPVIDFGMTPLRQRYEKVDFIEILKEDGLTKFRHPANDKMEEIAKVLIDKFKKNNENEIKEEIISLQSIRSPETRISFFILLIRNIDNFDLNDVSRIQVSKLKEELNHEEDSDSEEIADSEDEMIGLVKKAAFDGIGLLNSEEYQNLKAKGFFISSIVWTSIERNGNGDKFQFEALFENGESCTDFVYNVKGYYKRTENGDFAVTRLPLNELQKSAYLKEIEKSARAALVDCLRNTTDRK